MKHLSLVVVMILLVGCMQVKDETSKTMEVSDYADMGEIHNSFLDNALEKYDSSLTGRLAEVNLAHLRTLGIAPERLAVMEDRFGALSVACG